MRSADVPTPSIMPSWLPRVNKLIVNRVQGLWAPFLPPWAMIIHTGRKSGRTFAIPVLAFRRDSQLSIALVYGSDAQWVKNVLAADGCEVRRGGKRSRLTAPQVVGAEAVGQLPRPTAMVSRRVGVLVADIEA